MIMIDLYYLPLSPPSRAVRMLANALGINLNIKELDVTKGEQFEPEYLQVSINIYSLYNFNIIDKKKTLILLFNFFFFFQDKSTAYHSSNG